MNYNDNKEILRELYTQKGLIAYFEKDSQYLEGAFNKITEIWFANLAQIKEVKYLMIAEAPLWGNKESYIYNPDTPFTQFFYKSDLESVLNGVTINDKADFIKTCNDIGLLVIDISPFALNLEDTIINYRRKSASNPYGITKREYKQLINGSLPFFFECKIQAIAPKVSNEIKVFFRYGRVKKAFQNIISDTLTYYGLIKSPNNILEISNQAGGVDREKFRLIINASTMK